MIKKVLGFLIIITLQYQIAFGLVPDRRRDFEKRDENVYLVIPAFASLPGVGVFVGIIASGSNLWGSGIDAAVTRAESVDGSDISINAYALREVPTGIPGLSFEYWFGDIRFERFTTFIPGRDSPNLTVPFTGEIKFQLLKPNFRIWQRRIQVSYTLVHSDGFSVNSEGSEVNQQAYGLSAGLKLDFTDDEIDPSKGWRFQYETSLQAPSNSVFGRASSDIIEEDFIKTEQYQLAIYIPWLEKNTLVSYNQFLQADAPLTEGEPGSGSISLRGYPQGRWSDRFGFATVLENRYTIPTGKNVDILLARGTLEGVQLAVFYEVGQVSDQNDGKLYQELHQSYGGGIRLLLEAIVLRLDFATSQDEGELQTYLTIDQPF